MKNLTLKIIILILLGVVIYLGYPRIQEQFDLPEMPTSEVIKDKDNMDVSKDEEKEENKDISDTQGKEDKLKEDVLQAIVDKRGDYGDLTITISEIIDDTYAKGGAMPASGGPGGGMWFAKKVDGKWELVWDGNGAIYCKDLEDYPDFPGRLISECYDEDLMKVIPR